MLCVRSAMANAERVMSVFVERQVLSLLASLLQKYKY